MIDTIYLATSRPVPNEWQSANTITAILEPIYDILALTHFKSHQKVKINAAKISERGVKAFFLRTVMIS